MTIWKRATVDVPPTEKSIVAKYVNGEVHVCNGKTIGPPPGFGSVGWAVQLKEFPLREIKYPFSYRFGTIESMTITRGASPVQFSNDGWFHTITDMQPLMRMPVSLNATFREHDEAAHNSMRDLFEEWLDLIENDPASVSVRSSLRRIPDDLNIRFVDQPTELTVEFTPMQPFCTAGTELARKMLEEGLEEKLANGNTATDDSVH